MKQSITTGGWLFVNLRTGGDWRPRDIEGDRRFLELTNKDVGDGEVTIVVDAHIAGMKLEILNGTVRVTLYIEKEKMG